MKQLAASPLRASMIGTADTHPIGNIAGQLLSPLVTLGLDLVENPALLGLSNTKSDWIVSAASQANGNANTYAVHNVVHTEENWNKHAKGEFAYIIHLQSTPKPPRDGNDN